MSNVVADLVAKLGLKPDVASWNKGDELIGKVKAALVAFTGYQIVKGVGNAIMATVELGGHLDDLSQKTGVSVEALQEWGFAAGTVGISMDEVGDGISKFSRGLDLATRTGKGPAADALKRLGIDFQSTAFKSLSLNDKVLEFADRLADVKDPGAKAKIAVDAFGKSGANLIPLFNQGKDGLAELTAEFKEFELTTKDVGTLDKFGDDIDKTKATLTGLKNQALVQIVPLLQEMLTGFREWVTVNKELIKSTIQTIVEGLITAFGYLKDAIGVVVDVIKFFIDNAELGKSVLTALGVIIGVFAANAAIAWAIAAAPIVLLIAGITAVVYAIRYLIKNWDTVKAAFRSGASKIWEGFKGVGKSILGFFTKTIPDAIKSAFRALFNFIADLPVIKQLIQLVEKIQELSRGATKGNLSPEGAARIHDAANRARAARGEGPLAPEPTRPDSAGPSANAAPVQIRGGDIKVEVNGTTGDTAAIGAEVGKRVKEHMDDWLAQTAEAIG